MLFPCFFFAFLELVAGDIEEVSEKTPLFVVFGIIIVFYE
jgi:hypothetical protein